jgi:O-methyltransferase involved in polyketide biosynthesis
MTDTTPTNDNNDQPIMATAQDALSAKEAAVRSGYYDDPFLQALDPNYHTQAHNNRRRQVEPLIKRGTHARVCCMDRAIATFIDLHQQLENNHTLQVIVLGAGKDTSFFRYITGRLRLNSSTKEETTSQSQSPPQTNVRWYEVDHEAVISEKVAAIQNAPDIFDAQVTGQQHGCWKLQSSNHDDNDDHDDNNNDATNGASSSCCYMISHDLRQDPQTLLDKMSRTSELDAHAPTLVVMECVQMYLPEESSRTLLQALVQHCPDACLCSYEPMLLTDPFGQVMEKNLVAAQVARPDSCLVRIRTLEQHLQRLTSNSGLFAHAVGCDMWSAYNHVLTKQQRLTANQCDFLDEVEEWMLIMKHYCLVVACTHKCTIRTRYCEVGTDAAMGFSSADSETVTNIG